MRALVLLHIILAYPVLAQHPDVHPPAQVHSIVAVESLTGAIGLRAHSRWSSVGRLVPWAESGIDAATRRFLGLSYGPRALGLMHRERVTAGIAQADLPYGLQTWREVGLTATGGALLAGAVALYNAQETFTPDEITQLDPADISGFDRPATENWSATAGRISDVHIWTLIVAPLGLALTEPGWERRLVLGAMYGEALLISNGLVQLLQGAAERTRPYAYNDNPEIPEELRLEVNARRSFPSSHTANAFAAAVFLSSVYTKLHPRSLARKWVWVGSLTAAGLVGYLRYEAGKHFPTDIIAGAILGSAVGYVVPKIHEIGPVGMAVTPAGGLVLGFRLGVPCACTVGRALATGMRRKRIRVAR